MPVTVPQWTEYLNCPVCYNKYNDGANLPVSLGCSHTICRSCLTKLHQKRCPMDQSSISKSIDQLPPNSTIIQLVGGKVPPLKNLASLVQPENEQYYLTTMKFIEDLGVFFKMSSGAQQGAGDSSASSTNGTSGSLSRPMQRKLVTLINCQLVEEEGRARAMRAARSLGERTVTELILHHQNPQQLSANLWASVRARGCQFLGPAMQEEVLRLILLALEDGSALSRKVIVLFVVQRLESQYPHASKTAIGHVVQLLYRASCFKVTKRDDESSLMQLKEELRTYESLRREHDSQIVQIATEAGLRIAPEQWSSLLYGDTNHKSHMQSIIDKLQTPQSFSQSVDELVIALQRTGDPGNLSHLRVHLDLLANIDPSPETPAPSWANLEAIIKSTYTIVKGLVEFIHTNSLRKYDPPNIHGSKYKTSMCRDFVQKGACPRGVNCTFAHSEEEMDRYRAKNRRGRVQSKIGMAGGRLDSGDEMLAYSDIGMDSLDTDLLDIDDHSMLNLNLEIKSEPKKNGEEKLPEKLAVHLHNVPEVTREMEDHLTRIQTPTSRVAEIALEKVLYPPLGRPEVTSGHLAGYVSPSAYDPQRYPERMHSGNLVARGPIQSQYSIYDDPHLYSSRYMRPPQYHGEQYYRPLPPYHRPPGVSREYINQVAASRASYRYPQASARIHVLEDLFQRREEVLHHLNLGATPTSHASRLLARYTGPGTLSSNVISQRIQADTLMGQQRSVTPMDLARSVNDTVGTLQVSSSLAKIKNEVKEKGGELQVHPTGTDQLSYSPWSQGEDLISVPGSRGHVDTEMASPAPSNSRHIVYYEKVLKQEPHTPTSSQDESEEGEHFNFKDMAEFLKAVSHEAEDDDSFIPFTDRPIVSKYGPISRSARAKLKSTGPVDATASQGTETTPVTAVTPMERPYPISSQVPSRFASPGAPCNAVGHNIAVSLPTANIKLTSIVSATTSDSHTLHSMKQRIENLPTDQVPGPPSTAEREQLRHELDRLDHQIMLITEDENRAQQLQAVDMNIQAETGMVPMMPGHPYMPSMYPPNYEAQLDPRQYEPLIVEEQQVPYIQSYEGAVMGVPGTPYPAAVPIGGSKVYQEVPQQCPVEDQHNPGVQYFY